MNALVKKEIRLLLPVWLAVLVLQVALPWFDTNQGNFVEMTPIFFFFGMILLAVDAFGREFSLGTFSLLMSQPMERHQIWRTKITMLLLGAALIFTAYFVSCELRLHLMFTDKHALMWQKNQATHFWSTMLASATVLFVALAGGLWTTLLLRQISAAFWITFLVPFGILVTGTLSLPDKYVNNQNAVTLLLDGLAAIYTLAGFWLAHRLFHRAQDTAWAGGVISFSTWRYFSAGTKPAVSVRQRKPLAALLKKEFQLHSISLFCVGTLLALHLAIFVLRITYANFHRSSVAEGITDLFWTLWLVMPLIIGGTAVAEERKLGLNDSQFCLPVPRRTQFMIKFIPVMIFGTLAGGAMPMLLEGLAAHFGAPCENYRLNHYHTPHDAQYSSDAISFEVGFMALVAGLTWVSFFASTLARNFLQALSISIVIIIGCCLCASSGGYIVEHQFSVFGILPWPSVLPILIGAPTLLVTLMWLVYRNFNWFQEGWRLWRGNLLGVAKVVLFVFVSSALIYNRVWEVFEPAEPAHGPAKFSLASPPALQSHVFRSLLVRLPDGRVWFDSLDYPFLDDDNRPNRWKQFWWFLADPRPVSAGPREFIAGSNWVSITAARVDFWDPQSRNGSGRVTGYLDTVGVKANGTLWISSRAVPKAWTGGDMMQFGNETNWLQVNGWPYGGPFLLLKDNGTVWHWGTNHLDWSQGPTNWPTVRNSTPRQIGTDSDWKDIFDCGFANARKSDGSSWGIGLDFKTGRDDVLRQTNFDQVPFQTFGWDGNASGYVGNDGTLWVSNLHTREDGQTWEGTGFLKVGTDTNWVAAAINWPTLVALKADGSLWKWQPAQKSTAEFSKFPPTQLGIHSDGVGLTGTWGGVVSLAADGSLWFWSKTASVGQALKPPKQPRFLGNVFDEAK